MITPKNAAASPDGPGSSSRRGLRTRTPAQQRPYYHNAQVFDELVSDEPEAETDATSSPHKPKQKLRLTNLAQVSYPEQVAEDNVEQVEEKILIDDDDDDELMLEPDEPGPTPRAHYKGKGRAWKKTCDDEDEDYKSPVKGKQKQPKRQIGRRKSTQTTEQSNDGFEDKEPIAEQQLGGQEQELVDPIVQSSAQKASKKQRKPRRIHNLSEEFVRDDSDTAAEELRENNINLKHTKETTVLPRTPAQKTPKKRGRPRKSDPDSTLKSSVSKDSVSKDPAPKDTTTPAVGGDVTPAKKKASPNKKTPNKPAEQVSLSDLSEDEQVIKNSTISEAIPEKLAQPEVEEPSNPVTPPAEKVE